MNSSCSVSGKYIASYMHVIAISFVTAKHTGPHYKTTSLYIIVVARSLTAMQTSLASII